MCKIIKCAWKAIYAKCAEWYGDPFTEHPLDYKKWYEKLGLRFRQGISVFWSEMATSDTTALRAAAMTYSTIVVVIPLFAIAVFIAKQSDIALNALETVLDYILQDNNSVIDVFKNAGQARATNGRNLFLWLIILPIVMISIDAFFVRIQRRINDIWQTSDPGFKKHLYSIYMWVASAFIIIVWATLLTWIKNDVINDIISFIIVTVILAAVQIVLPYKRIVGVWQAIRSSVLASAILILGWRYVFAFFTIGFSTYVKSKILAAGLSSLLVIYLSWMVCFLISSICSVLDNSDVYTYRKEVRNLQPFTKMYVTIFVVSSVIRHYLNEGKWPTLVEVREGMFEHDKSSLAVPMSLLIPIIQDLCRQKIILKEEFKTPFPKKNIFIYKLNKKYNPDTLTVDQLLTALLFEGNKKLRITYTEMDANLHVLLESQIKTALRHVPTLVKNIVTDMREANLRQFENEMYKIDDNVYQDIIDIRMGAKSHSKGDVAKQKMRANISKSLKLGLTKEQLIKQVEYADDSQFYPFTKEEYIDLIKDA